MVAAAREKCPSSCRQTVKPLPPPNVLDGLDIKFVNSARPAMRNSKARNRYCNEKENNTTTNSTITVIIAITITVITSIQIHNINPNHNSQSQFTFENSQSQFTMTQIQQSQSQLQQSQSHNRTTISKKKNLNKYRSQGVSCSPPHSSSRVPLSWRQ